MIRHRVCGVYFPQLALFSELVCQDGHVVGILTDERLEDSPANQLLHCCEILLYLNSELNSLDLLTSSDNFFRW